MKRIYHLWRLYDADGNLLIEGRKRDVINKCYHRYVYGHIFTDQLYKTNIPIV